MALRYFPLESQILIKSLKGNLLSILAFNKKMFGQPYIKHMILKMGSLLSGHLGINLVTDRIKTTV